MPSESHRTEAQAWLKTTLQEITDSLHLHWRDDRHAVSRDVMEFVGFAQQAVYRGMERELASVEKQNAQNKEKVSCTSQNISDCYKWKILTKVFMINDQDATTFQVSK